MTITSLEEYESAFPNADYTVQPWPEGDFRRTMPPKIKFFVPNKHVGWRVQTLDTKEPDTIKWLANMMPGEVLYDVGANIGQYSLIAARRGLRVHAFEPESQNFALLCKNIALNRLFDAVTPWPLCLSNEAGPGIFYSQSVEAGGSCSSFGEEVNFHLQPKKYPVKQGSISMTMQSFASTCVPPDHVKIDVDGIEHKVVEGMIDPPGSRGISILGRVKSVLVEINTALPEHLAIIDRMAEHGLHPDLETAEIARRTEGAFAGIGNMIFYRKP